MFYIVYHVRKSNPLRLDRSLFLQLNGTAARQYYDMPLEFAKIYGIFIKRNVINAPNNATSPRWRAVNPALNHTEAIADEARIYRFRELKYQIKYHIMSNRMNQYRTNITFLNLAQLYCMATPAVAF